MKTQTALLVVLATTLLAACSKFQAASSTQTPTATTNPANPGAPGAASAYCAAQPSLVMTATSAYVPPFKARGFINGTPVFDECASTPFNFTFVRPTSLDADGTYHFVLYSNSYDAFSYPQPNAQISLKIQVTPGCGGPYQTVLDKTVTLIDHQGCYSTSAVMDVVI